MQASQAQATAANGATAYHSAADIPDKSVKVGVADKVGFGQKRFSPVMCIYELREFGSSISA
jgi:hypothetical protein